MHGKKWLRNWPTSFFEFPCILRGFQLLTNHLKPYKPDTPDQRCTCASLCIFGLRYLKISCDILLVSWRCTWKKCIRNGRTSFVNFPSILRGFRLLTNHLKPYKPDTPDQRCTCASLCIFGLRYHKISCDIFAVSWRSPEKMPHHLFSRFILFYEVFWFWKPFETL